MTAEPLTADELAEVGARSDKRMAGPSWTEAEMDRARLLATLDAHRERYAEVLMDMRKRGVLILDRDLWARYLPDDDAGRWVAYVPFAGMLADEVDAHYAAHPEALERDRAHAREVAERYGLRGAT